MPPRVYTKVISSFGSIEKTQKKLDEVRKIKERSQQVLSDFEKIHPLDYLKWSRECEKSREFDKWFESR